MHTTILSGEKFYITLERLCYQLIENHGNFEKTALLGMQPRGIYLGKAIHKMLQKILPEQKIRYGDLDPTFYRDDFRRHKDPILPSSVNINFSLEGLNIVIIDDVLYTGRTIRAGMDAMMDFGRPDKVELLALVDRRYSRQLPIEADYVGLTVDTRASQKVKVNWKDVDGGEDSVKLISLDK